MVGASPSKLIEVRQRLCVNEGSEKRVTVIPMV
jgi:hypothetical protein